MTVKYAVVIEYRVYGESQGPAKREVGEVVVQARRSVDREERNARERFVVHASSHIRDCTGKTHRLIPIVELLACKFLFW